MPNPKLGTVSADIKTSINNIKNGLVEIKHDKDGNIGVNIGKKSFSTENLLNNLKHFIDFIKKEKPDVIKGDFIKNIFITSSMGISVKLSNKGI
jgi:large subunit ribosomal protein L1